MALLSVSTATTPSYLLCWSKVHAIDKVSNGVAVLIHDGTPPYTGTRMPGILVPGILVPL